MDYGTRGTRVIQFTSKIAVLYEVNNELPLKRLTTFA